MIPNFQKKKYKSYSSYVPLLKYVGFSPQDTVKQVYLYVPSHSKSCSEWPTYQWYYVNLCMSSTFKFNIHCGTKNKMKINVIICKHTS